MPALETVGQYLTESRRLLQDQFVPYRYPDEDLIDAINIGLQEVRRLRADLLLPQKFEVPWIDPETPDVDATVPMDVMYRSALVYYICGRAQLRDDEATVDTRASGFMQKFLTQMLVITS